MEPERGPEGREGQPGREGAKGREGIPGITGAAGHDGPEGPAGPTGKTFSQPIKMAFVLLTLIFFFTLAGFAVVVDDVHQNSDRLAVLYKENDERISEIKLLVDENQTRIADIQSSRTFSCRKTYEGIREVFRQFFPPIPRTKEQQDDIDLFNSTIDDLRKGCNFQTAPERE